MKKLVITGFVVSSCFCLASCSSLRFPGVYRLTVAQGNYLEQKMIDKLEVGMTRRQVRYVMGTPLVQDTFSPDRWDYYFTVRHAEKKLSEYHFAVFFDGDTLTRWEGNYEPTKASEKERQDEALKATKKKEDAKFKKKDDTRF